MRIELALLAGLLSSSVLAYGDEGWDNTGPKVKTITKVITQNHTKTCTVTKTKCITKTKTESQIQTVTVTATPSQDEESKDELPPPEEDEEAEEEPATPKDVEGKPAPQEEQEEPATGDEEKPEDPEVQGDETAEKPTAVKLPAEKPMPVKTPAEKPKPKPTPVKTPAEKPAATKPAPAKHTIKATEKDGKDVFDPPTVKAAVGDWIVFSFQPGTHSVARGVFDKPCTPLEEAGFFSGVRSVKSGDKPPVFIVEVKDTEPIWFYCSVGRHCQGGMVGVVNPGPDDDLEAYVSASADAPANVHPKKVGGGRLRRKRSIYRF